MIVKRVMIRIQEMAGRAAMPALMRYSENDRR